MQLPDWTPLAGVEPPVSDGSGRIVGLVASEEASRAGWAPGAALDLARSWSARGRRVILVDCALQAPSLHDAAGIQNREGLSDAALHGASVSRVTHPVDAGFFLITAGTPVADTRSVVRSGRWHRLAEGITDAGVVVLLYLRDGDAGTAAFLGSASDIVVLSGPADGTPLAVEDLQPLVRAVAGPDGVGTRGPSRPAATEAATSARAPAAAVAGEGEGGLGRLFLLMIIALLVAAGLGYVLTSLL